MARDTGISAWYFISFSRHTEGRKSGLVFFSAQWAISLLLIHMKSSWTPFTPIYSLPHPLALALICSRYLKTSENRSEATKSSGRGLQQLLCLWHTNGAVKWSITGSLLKILSCDLIPCETLYIAICLRASLLFMTRISQSVHKVWVSGIQDSPHVIWSIVYLESVIYCICYSLSAILQFWKLWPTSHEGVATSYNSGSGLAT